MQRGVTSHFLCSANLIKSSDAPSALADVMGMSL